MPFRDGVVGWRSVNAGNGGIQYKYTLMDASNDNQPTEISWLLHQRLFHVDSSVRVLMFSSCPISSNYELPESRTSVPRRTPPQMPSSSRYQPPGPLNSPPLRGGYHYLPRVARNPIIPTMKRPHRPRVISSSWPLGKGTWIPA